MAANTAVQPRYDTTYSYTETYGSKYLDYTIEEPVSLELDGGTEGGGITYCESKSYSATFTKSLTATAKSCLLSALAGKDIGLDYGCELALEASNSTEVSYSVDIAPGKVWQLWYVPRVYHTKGTLTYTISYNNGWTTDTVDVDAKLLVKLPNGFADGRLYAKEVE